jgi:hypothetical protein
MGRAFDTTLRSELRSTILKIRHIWHTIGVCQLTRRISGEAGYL